MANTAGNANESLMARLATPPYLGLFIFAIILIYKPVAHCLLVLQHHFFTGPERYLVGFLVGLLGFTIIGKGLRRDELMASAMGYMGGALVWMGWFEYAFDFFGETLGIAPLTDPVGGFTVLSPNLVLMEATVVPFAAMLILFGANRETRCRMLMWFQRNLRLAPEKPTTGYKRNFAWVTAWETIFVSWAFYLQIILLYDPRLVGINHPVTFAMFFVYLAWGGYLLNRLAKYNEPAGAIRYAIPTVAAFWIAIEMASHWGWFTEIWVKPIQYPVANAMFIAAFVAGSAMVLVRRPGHALGSQIAAAE